MKTLPFKCTLLSDVILNRKSASEGANSTLDFIPGNCFLGIAAARYADFGKDALEVFHSGRVRFGDAHPAADDGTRTLRAAASFFYPKLHGEATTYYNYHLIPDPSAPDVKSLQLKQCRSGFYSYSTECPTRSKTEAQFSIKSAYDSEHRRSKDSAMFGYEALQKDLVFFFEVEVDSEDERLVEMVSESLKGTKRLGRSRSAQYGLVNIEPCTFGQVLSTGKGYAPGRHTVYADGRLVFLDEYGLPTFRPKAEDLGFPEGARIDWSKSQIRTFQYAPYNGIRKNFDMDRCGIEKGSVLVVESPAGGPSESAYVGVFKNEGFGRVIYDPAFLAVESYTDKVAGDTAPNNPASHIIAPAASDSTLVKLLKERHNQEVTTTTIYRVVNQWANENKGVFSDESFASQWGAIRAIATQERDFARLKEALLGTRKEHPGFLMHGVAETKWKERRRRFLLERFLEERHRDVPGYEWLATVNLSSIMAKLAKKK